MRDENCIEKEKEVAYYSALVDAWVTTCMEKDRTLVTLATAGIGLLVSLLTTVGTTGRMAEVVYTVAMLSFVVTLFLGIAILGRNATHIEHVVHGRSDQDKRLVLLDRLMIATFGIGVLASVMIGVLAIR